MFNQIIADFFVEVNDCLLEFVRNKGLKDVFTDFKPIINRENGSKIRGDFSLNFVSPKFQSLLEWLPQISEQLVIQSKSWNTFTINSFRIRDKINRVLLFVCRPTALPKLIRQFSKILDQNTFKNSGNYFVICAAVNTKNKFVSERLRLVSQSVSKLLTTSYVNLNLSPISDQVFDQLMSSAETSSFCESNINNKLFLRIGSQECIVIDKSCRILFELTHNLHDLIKSHKMCEKKSTIIIVTSESFSYKMTQSYRLLSLLHCLDIDFRLISVSNVNTDIGFDQYVRDIGDRLIQQNDSSFKDSGLL